MRSVKRMFTSHMFRAGSYATFAAVMVIAIVIVVNLLAGSLPSTLTKFDMTQQSLFTLSDQTKRIVSSLDKDVSLYLLAAHGGEDQKVQTLLDRYAALSDRVKLQLIDPNEKPTFLKGYEIEGEIYANSVIVQCGEKYRFVGYDSIYQYDYSNYYYGYSQEPEVSFNGEGALTSAIHYVSSTSLPKIYALTGHGETALGDSVKTAIEQENMELSDLSLLSMQAVPEDASCVLINVPTGDISTDEATMLNAYLEKGGSVLVLTDYIETGKMPNLLTVTAKMGMTAGEGMIVEGDSAMSLRGYAWYLLPTIESHAITQPLVDGKYYALLPMAQPIIASEGSSATVEYLLTTSDKAYTKKEAYNMTSAEKAEGDAQGTFHMAAASTLGEGHMVWFTSSMLLDDSMNQMVSGANQDLVLNSLGWMTAQEETISIRAKSLSETGLTVSSQQSALWSIVLIGLIPLALIAIGIVIWVRRKRR